MKKINFHYIVSGISILLLIIVVIFTTGFCYASVKEVEHYKSINDELTNENIEQNKVINDLENKVDTYETEIESLNKQLVLNKETRQIMDLPSRGGNSRQININPHTKSGLSVETLNKMLSGTGLEGQGQAFYDMENTYNVNALFAMGVAMHESANGYKKANTHNYFGFRGNNGWMSFNSASDCIMYFGKLIHNNYNNKKSIEAIQSKYCPDGSDWSGRVKEHMTILYRKTL